MLLWSLLVPLLHKPPEIPETLSAVFNKWWGRCCNRPSVGVCVLTINVHELHAWKKDKDKKKVGLHRSPAPHSLFPLSRNTSCQRALPPSRIRRTNWFALFFDLMNEFSSESKEIYFFYSTFPQSLLFDAVSFYVRPKCLVSLPEENEVERQSGFSRKQKTGSVLVSGGYVSLPASLSPGRPQTSFPSSLPAIPILHPSRQFLATLGSWLSVEAGVKLFQQLFLAKPNFCSSFDTIPFNFFWCCHCQLNSEEKVSFANK